MAQPLEKDGLKTGRSPSPLADGCSSSNTAAKRCSPDGNPAIGRASGRTSPELNPAIWRQEAGVTFLLSTINYGRAPGPDGLEQGARAALRCALMLGISRQRPPERETTRLIRKRHRRATAFPPGK